MLTHLENFTRQNIQALWDPPYVRSEPSTQETEAAEPANNDADVDSQDVDAALRLFGMQAG